MKSRKFTVGALLCLWATASPAVTPTPSPSPEDGYSKAIGILMRNCAGCHQASDHPGALFLNKANLSEKSTMDLVIHLIETSQMPPAHAKFKNTPDGNSLLAWLKAERARKK
jgi:mono/diheme cytochrome c family protein